MWHAITNGVLKFQAYDMPFIVAAKPLTKIQTKNKIVIDGLLVH